MCGSYLCAPFIVLLAMFHIYWRLLSIILSGMLSREVEQLLVVERSPFRFSCAFASSLRCLCLSKRVRVSQGVSVSRVSIICVCVCARACLHVRACVRANTFWCAGVCKCLRHFHDSVEFGHGSVVGKHILSLFK